VSDRPAAGASRHGQKNAQEQKQGANVAGDFEKRTIEELVLEQRQARARVAVLVGKAHVFRKLEHRSGQGTNLHGIVARV
jgi:hypothetical protein